MEKVVVTGFAYSTEFIREMLPIYRPRYFVGDSARKIVGWCVDHFNEFGEAPGKLLRDILTDKITTGEVTKDQKKVLTKIVDEICDHYEDRFHLRYTLKKAKIFFQERELELHQEKIDDLLEKGERDAATELASNFRPQSFDSSDDLDLSDPKVLLKVESLFMASYDPLLEFDGKLGELLNSRLVRGGFVAFMASEKRGKSFFLLDLAFRATAKRYKVAFFQAGDMTEDQQLKRICSYLARKPTDKRYIGENYLPVPDCIRNQLDLCNKEERRCDFGVFISGEFNEENMRREVTRENLIEAYQDYGQDYKPCTLCDEYHTHRLGTPWFERYDIASVLTENEAKKKVEQYFVKRHRRFKISTHPNNTLTVGTIKSICNRWENEDGFVPDVIVIDYADLLTTDKTKDFRHAQNEIWKDMRALSQERDCLVVTATQADAKSYESNLLKMTNFSEDKRKYAHVTAMFGLNQDKDGREKKLGILRVNPLVVREGEFDSTSAVTVLQNLNFGRPYLYSYL